MLGARQEPGDALLTELSFAFSRRTLLQDWVLALDHPVPISPDQASAG